MNFRSWLLPICVVISSLSASCGKKLEACGTSSMLQAETDLFILAVLNDQDQTEFDAEEREILRALVFATEQKKDQKISRKNALVETLSGDGLFKTTLQNEEAKIEGTFECHSQKKKLALLDLEMSVGRSDESIRGPLFKEKLSKD